MGCKPFPLWAEPTPRAPPVARMLHPNFQRVLSSLSSSSSRSDTHKTFCKNKMTPTVSLHSSLQRRQSQHIRPFSTLRLQEKKPQKEKRQIGKQGPSADFGKRTPRVWYSFFQQAWSQGNQESRCKMDRGKAPEQPASETALWSLLYLDMLPWSHVVGLSFQKSLAPDPVTRSVCAG